MNILEGIGVVIVYGLGCWAGYLYRDKQIKER